MEWRDEGIVLAARPHGETSVILEMFTRTHGRHLGVVHGGVSRKKSPMLQPGNQLDAVWRARLESHMGGWTVELKRSRAAGILSDPLRLAALTSACSMASFALPEREAMEDFQTRTEDLCDAIVDGKGWITDYIYWEMALLEVGVRWGERSGLCQSAYGSRGQSVGGRGVGIQVVEIAGYTDRWSAVD